MTLKQVGETLEGVPVFSDVPPKTMREMVLDFHRAFDCGIGGEPQQLRSDILKDRLRFSSEEFFEILEASGCHVNAIDVAKASVEACIDSLNPENFDMIGFVDGHSDLGYFLAGTMVASGVNDDPMHAEVHRANMAKLWPNGRPRHRSGDGKVVKPPGWVPPDIEGELRKQGWKG